MPGEHNHSLNRPKHEDCTTPVNEIKYIEADITVDEKINIKESNQVDIEEIIDDINENGGLNTKVDYKASENKQDIKEETKEKNRYSDIKQKKLFM
jgi:hypothetical protein